MLGKEAERAKLNVCLYTADTAARQDIDRLDLEGKKREKKALGDRVAQQHRRKHDIQSVKVGLERDRNRVKLELMELKDVVHWLENEPSTQKSGRFERKLVCRTNTRAAAAAKKADAL